MALDITLLIFGFALIVLGVIGCIVPAIPGPPLSYCGILLLHFTKYCHFSSTFLIVWAVVVVAVTVLDYLIPVWGTRKFGGSKWGAWGSVIGLIVGLIYSPVGIFLGALGGALVGELIYQGRLNRRENSPKLSGKERFNKSLKAAFGSFIGLIFGILLKLTVSIWLAVAFIKKAILALF
ncbi:MAG TPA: DUF456 domain-containing protein [Bacteroidales bacterium]|nr:DUF456 domain-containing protein [Bacteroidales bacterium]HQP03484.1 DUF456 domain-containing protein [Bacteroidales bacterium]